MEQSDLLDMVIVFDLDDTLYKEIYYQNSGFVAICNWIEFVYGISLWTDLKKLQESENSDILGELCRAAELKQSVKETLLWVYRLHQPSIQLLPGVSDFLNALQTNWKAAILTDGRSVSQRLKLKSLGLEHIPAYISEDFDSEKPAPLRFNLIMLDMPAKHYTYVGDNLEKDFFVPNNLGWTTICLRDDGSNIHKQIISGKTDYQIPKFWINNFFELNGILNNELI